MRLRLKQKAISPHMQRGLDSNADKRKNSKEKFDSSQSSKEALGGLRKEASLELIDLRARKRMDGEYAKE